MAAQGAEVRTFGGQGLDDPTATIRLDYTPQGFHAQVLGDGGAWAIDPYTFGDTAHYSVFTLPDLPARESWVCHNGPDNSPPEPENPFTDRATGTTLRSYDIAVAAVPSYTNFHGGSVTGAQAAIVTLQRTTTGELILDICWDCHAIWFDQFESTSLAPKSVIELFRLIHEHRDKPARGR